MAEQGIRLSAIDSPWRRLLATLLLAAVVATSWHGGLDRFALERTDVTLTRALAAYAIARTLNGVISVAQGTELAVEPMGVGMTLTVGEILDPLNDLIERFSWLALMAATSLGAQALLTDMFAQAWLNGLVSAAAVVLLAALWIPALAPLRGLCTRICGTIVFGRFLFTLTALVATWADGAFLEARQNESIANLSMTSDQLADPPETIRGEAGWLDWLGSQFDAAGRVTALKDKVESTIAEMINLIVVFIVQTLLIPVATLWLFIALFRTLWRGT
jgi:hypothetical protein